MRAAVALVAVLCAACGSPEETRRLRVDENMPERYQSAIVAGAIAWEKAAPVQIELELAPPEYANVRMGECPTESYACAGWEGTILFQQVDDNWRRLQQTATHEIGHWLGISVHLPDGNVMQAGWTEPLPMTPTSADVTALYEAMR